MDVRIIHNTDSDKFIAKFDWNVNDRNKFTFRYNLLDAVRALPPHPFATSFNNTGRGPNENSLPFQNAGYAINNELNSFAGELNTQADRWANRFFASYNRFRDFREPNSAPFPTIEIGEDGVTYTTLGHEPFSIHNLLDQDVFQITDDFSLYRGNHVYTLGANYEQFSFGNSFNLFYYGFFPCLRSSAEPLLHRWSSSSMPPTRRTRTSSDLQRHRGRRRPRRSRTTRASRRSSRCTRRTTGGSRIR